MPESQPEARFEFRAFAQSFGIVTRKLRQAAACDSIEESRESYLVSSEPDSQNVKIRRGRLEIKRLVRTLEGLEQWEPAGASDFPPDPAFLRENVFPALSVTCAAPDSKTELQPEKSGGGWNEWLDQVIRPHPGLARAAVFKRRFRFQLGECSAELDDVLVNGAAIRSAAVESTDPREVLRVLEQLELSGYENVSYPRALRRILGLERLPEDAWW